MQNNSRTEKAVAAAGDSRDSARMFRVASYNMRKAIGTDRRRRPDRTIEVLNELSADVIALQEADKRFGSRDTALPFHLLDEHSGYKPITLSTRSNSIGWHGNALLVRKETEIFDCGIIHLPSLEPRGAVFADVKVNGGIVRIVGMHLDLSGLWRRRQAHAVIAHLENMPDDPPVVLMGDLNEWSARGGCLRDFAHHLEFANCGRSFHTRRAIARLDRIMVSRRLKVLDSGVHNSPTARKASDHFPIWATLQEV